MVELDGGWLGEDELVAEVEELSAVLVGGE